MSADAAAPAPSPAEQSRAVARACRTAVLSTILPGKADGDAPHPYGSLVLVAFDHDAAPLLLISTLAEHTKNLAADGRVSLLCDGTAGYAEPLTGPRVTLVGSAEKTTAPRHRARFLARHPGAAMYADFKDFAFYRIEVSRAHVVAGFGRIHWVPGAAYRYGADCAALMEAEAEIIEHMNTDHADAVQLYATRLLNRPGGDWKLCGVDPEGADLIHAGEIARLPFDKPVTDAEGARVELVRLVKRARAAV